MYGKTRQSTAEEPYKMSIRPQGQLPKADAVNAKHVNNNLAIPLKVSKTTKRRLILFFFSKPTNLKMCVRVELEGGLKDLALTTLRLFYLNSVLKKDHLVKTMGCTTLSGELSVSYHC